MRPVERGPVPLEADGSNKVFTSYGNARRDLIDRMGQYCSYCNQKLPSSLAVEHVQPKSLNSALELVWSNFLLGCTNCNSTKGDKPVNLPDYLWPDVHNTHLAFTYTPDGKIDVNPALPDALKVKAQKMLDLVGLQNYPDNATASDRRWLNRQEAFVKANLALLLYQSASAKGASEECEKLLGFWASDNGFFSIWMLVFNAYPNVKKQIVLSFIGTSDTCFDGDVNSLQRTAEL